MSLFDLFDTMTSLIGSPQVGDRTVVGENVLHYPPFVNVNSRWELVGNSSIWPGFGTLGSTLLSSWILKNKNQLRKYNATATVHCMLQHKMSILSFPRQLSRPHLFDPRCHTKPAPHNPVPIFRVSDDLSQLRIHPLNVIGGECGFSGKCC